MRQYITKFLTEFTKTSWLRLRIRLEYKSLYYPSQRVETFSQNVAHAPYRAETQSNLLLHIELKALT
jgi:hypothetical protein